VHIDGSQGVQQYEMVPGMWCELATAATENMMQMVSGSA